MKDWGQYIPRIQKCLALFLPKLDKCCKFSWLHLLFYQAQFCMCWLCTMCWTVTSMRFAFFKVLRRSFFSPIILKPTIMIEITFVFRPLIQVISISRSLFFNNFSISLKQELSSIRTDTSVRRDSFPWWSLTTISGQLALITLSVCICMVIFFSIIRDLSRGMLITSITLTNRNVHSSLDPEHVSHSSWIVPSSLI